MVFYALAVFTYVLLRSYNLSYTFDEISSMQIANGDDWYMFTTNSNNHILNTALMRASLWLFDVSEFTLRLPNALGCLFFLGFAYKIGHFLGNKKLFFTLVLLTTMPFLIDFFSLARGYGLALGFMLASLYYALKYRQSKHVLLALASTLFAMLAVLSNFTLFNYFLALICVLLFITFLADHSRVKKLISILVILTTTGIFLYTLTPLLFELKNGGQLYFGGRTGFVYDVVYSLGRCFAYNQLSVGLGEFLFALLFGLAGIIALWSSIRALFKRQLTSNAILSILFVLCCIAPILQHLLFDTNYPAERTAAMYYPLIILVLITGLKRETQTQKWFLNGMTVLFALHFAFSINLQSFYSWRFDSESKTVVEILNKEPKEIHLGVDYLYMPSLHFYRQLEEMHDFHIEQVVDCWEYDLNLEELDPYYFGAGESSKTGLTYKDGMKIASSNMDYYYLHQFVVDELKRLNFKVKTIARYDNARSSLITLRAPQ